MKDVYKKLNKDYSIDEIAENLVNVPGEEIANFLSELDINIPRSIRFNSLQKVLFPVLQQEYNDLLKSESDAEGPERLEESRRQTRLTWIDSFSETQFENEIYKFNNKDLEREFLSEFWKRLLNFLLKEAVPKEDIANFIEKASKKYEKNQGTPPLRLFNKAIEPFIYDEVDTFDGLTRSVFASRVVLSATISEIKQIGSKYNMKVPTRLTKNQVMEIVVNELKKRNEYIPDIHSELNEFNLKELEDFARLNNIIAFAYINKDQMIEYMYKEYDSRNVVAKRYLQDPEALAKLDQETEEIVVEFETRIEEADKKPEEEFKPVVEPQKEPVIETPEVNDDIISDIQEEKKPEETKVEEKPVKPVIIQQDSESIEELKNEILSLKQIVLELQTKVENLQEDTTRSNVKLDTVSKKLFPKWFKIIVLILFFVSVFISIFIPLSIYYPDAPVISQIAWLFDQIPFLGGRSLLEFLQGFFERLLLG
jgi:hypothetical protein